MARMTTSEQHHTHHGHVHLDEEHWRALAAQAELEGEVFGAFVTDTMAWVTELRGPDAPAVSQVIDIGSGPGVGTCELARLFPAAHVTAVDSSPSMLDRTTQRAAGAGLGTRISTLLAELPGGLDGLAQADVIWASMSLHHVGDEVTALRLLGDLLLPGGLLAIAEIEGPMRVLPDDLGLGRPGLVGRLETAASDWFASMREGLDHSVPSEDLGTMIASAGLEVVGSRLDQKRFDPPLSDLGRQVALGQLERIRGQLGERLDADDLAVLDVLIDPDDPRGVMHRADMFAATSRQIVIARPFQDR